MTFRQNWKENGHSVSKTIRLVACCGTLVCALVVNCSVSGAEKTDIEVEYQNTEQYQVQSQFQHEGQVITEQADQDKAQVLPLNVKARLDYHERFVGSESSPQAVRYYETAHAAMTIDKVNTISKLEDSNRLIVSRIKSSSNQYQIASVKSLLQQHELDLLRNPADPLSFPGLVNKQGLSIGEEWEPTHDALARFLGVDRVISSNLKLKLKDADKDMAKVYILGKVKADVDDVTTTLQVMGVMKVDRELKLVSALRLNITENRRAGQIAPGFDGKSKIDLQISKSKDIDQLSTASLKTIAQKGSIQNLLKWVAKSGSFELQYQPKWKLIAADEEAAILRYLDNGDLLAQCNVVKLDSRPADKPLLLEDFRREVAKIIAADATARVVDASQSRTSNGLKALKVVVEGVEDEVPLNWIYYNVAHADGRQVTFVFTLEEEIVSRARPATEKLVNGFEFHSRSKAKAKSASRKLGNAKSVR